MTKLHLGCGKRNFPGFINVDLADYPHIHYKRSVDDLSVFGDSSADLIYASHVLEYFAPSDASRVLKEWNRVLKLEGELRLAVPDFNALAEVYKKYGDMDSLQGVIYGLMEVGKDRPQILFHKAIYDFNMLKNTLEENGFYKVKKYDWKDFLPDGQEDHSAAYIPRRDFQNGILVSLNVEAKKAGPIRAVGVVYPKKAKKLYKKFFKKTKKIIDQKKFWK